MNNKAGSCWQVTFTACPEYSPEIQEFAEEFFDVVAYDYRDDGTEQLIGYKNKNFTPEHLKEKADQKKLKLPDYTTTYLESANWLKDNVIEFSPVEVDDFLIYGIHEKKVPHTDKLALRIYAATAFGSEHQTTKSCLRAISALNKSNAAHYNILDMGCGSGILSLAAAKLWPDSMITAADIDDEAVIVTLQNAVDNDLEKQIRVQAGDGYQTALVQKNAPYDIILSNILARPLIAMAPALTQALKVGGYCVLSGFVEDQQDWVIEAHQAQGLELLTIFEDGVWRAALMEKK